MPQPGAPRRADAAIRTASCNAVMARAATRFPRTIDERHTGATSSSPHGSSLADHDHADPGIASGVHTIEGIAEEFP